MLEASEQLGPRERQVLELVALGYTNQQIALALHLRVATVKGYLSTIISEAGTSKSSAGCRVVGEASGGRKVTRARCFRTGPIGPVRK